ERKSEAPLNIYGYSKFLFDQAVRRRLGEAGSQIAGFRYFNVYGPNEWHKGRVASVAWHFFNQYSAERRVRPFVGSGGYGDGEQRRDFISVEDVVKINPSCRASSTPAPGGRRASTTWRSPRSTAAAMQKAIHPWTWRRLAVRV